MNSDELKFPAMGCVAQVVVVGGGPGLAAAARAQVEHLDAIWSRFRPESEISRCNRAGGNPTVVSESTLMLVERAIEGWYLTAGRFDPTVLPSVEAIGYDRTFGSVVSSKYAPDAVVPSPGCVGITVDRETSTVTVPAGVRLDPGGIGKGLAADTVLAALCDAGAEGACVNLGGDLRVAGAAPGGSDGWTVTLEDPYDASRDLARATITDAGIATTSRTYRTWERSGVQVHHLIDPATGAPAWTDLASVTVIAAEAWWAEVLAKAAFVAGPVEATDLLAAAGATGALVDDGGFLHPLPGSSWEVLAPCWP